MFNFKFLLQRCTNGMKTVWTLNLRSHQDYEFPRCEMGTILPSLQVC